MRKDEETPKITEEGAPTGKTFSRREFLKVAGTAGAVVGLGGGLGALVTGCGEEEQATTTAPPTTAPPPGETTTTVAGPEPPAQDKVVFGGARPISGAFAIFEQVAFGPVYKKWVDDVNKAGGLNVAGKKLPIELLIYDDKTDMDTSMRLLDKLMKEDQVDFLFAPAGTAFLFAAAAVTSAAGYLLLSAEGGATTLEAQMAAGKLPLFFQGLNYSNHAQQPMMRQIMEELGITKAAYVYVDDLHGIEYEAAARMYWGAGIDITSSTAVPRDVKDLTSVVRQMEAEGVDIVLSSQMPPGNILLMQTMMTLEYNPKAVVLGPGGPQRRTHDIFGANMNGVMTFGAWSVNSSPEAKEFHDRLIEFTGGDPAVMEYWGPLFYRGQLEHLQQAIEKAATLDHEKIAEVMRTERFNTVLGETFYDNIQRLDASCHPGQIGQWQNGVYEVIDVGVKRTAPPIYPKPPWGPVAPPAT